MSYDLVFWREQTSREPSATWDALSASKSPSWLEPLSSVEVREAFERRFGARLEVEPTANGARLSGPGFEVLVEDGTRHLHVTCSWGVLKSPEGAAALAELRHVCCVDLGFTCFNPQVGVARRPPRAPRGPTSARGVEADARRALEEEIRRGEDGSPESAAALRAYAALLTAANDPRGAAVLRDEPPRDVPGTMGPILAALWKRGLFHGEVRAAGFVNATFRRFAQPDEPLAKYTRQLLEHPSAMFLRSLSFDVGEVHAEISEDAFQEIAAAPYASSLRTLSTSEGLHIGDVAAALEAAPLLERFSTSPASAIFRPFEHARLEWLQLHGANLDADALAALGASTLPNLVGLSLGFAPHGGTREVDVSALSGLLGAPRLRALALRGARNAEAVARAIVASPCVSRLKELELAPIDDAALRVLIEAREAFSELETVFLALGSCSEEVVAAASEAFGARLLGGAKKKGLTAEPVISDRSTAPPARRVSARAKEPDSLSELEEGAHVTHPRFGAGVVESFDESAAKVTVRFEDGTERTLLSKFVSPKPV